MGLDHPRSGDLVAVAEPDRWFAYPWWLDDAKAPPFARTVDIHRKPGYDPVEMFLKPGTRETPLDATLVQGSHGLTRATGGGAATDTVLLASDAGAAARRGVRHARGRAGGAVPVVRVGAAGVRPRVVGGR